jgi:hypothetical protein
MHSLNPIVLRERTMPGNRIILIPVAIVDGAGLQLAGSCGCAFGVRGARSGLKAILGGLSLGRGISFPQCSLILGRARWWRLANGVARSA